MTGKKCSINVDLMTFKNLQCTGGRKSLDIWAPALLTMFSGIFCLLIVSLLSENKALSFEIRQHFGGLTKNVCGEMRFPTN